MWNWSEYKFTHTTPKGVWNPNDSVCEDLEGGFIDEEGRFDDEKLPEERKYHLIDDGEHVLSGLSDVQSSNADSTFAQQYQEEISRWFAAASVMLMEEDVIVMIEKWLHSIGGLKEWIMILSSVVLLTLTALWWKKSWPMFWMNYNCQLLLGLLP